MYCMGQHLLETWDRLFLAVFGGPHGAHIHWTKRVQALLLTLDSEYKCILDKNTEICTF